MNKQELLRLERLAHLTFADLQSAEPDLAERIKPRIEHHRGKARKPANDVPIGRHPAFAQDLARARVFRVAEAARMPERVAESLAELGGLHRIHEENLASAVERRTLSESDAMRAGRAIALHRLLDERTELLEAVSGAIDDPASLTALDQRAWVAKLRESRTRPPGGIALGEYAELLRKKVALAFPTESLRQRLDAARPKEALRGDAGADERARAIRRYGALKLDEVLEDGDRPRLAEAARRVDQAHRFFAANPGLLEKDLRPRSRDLQSIAFQPADREEDRRRLLALARGYQRAVTVAGDIDTAGALIDAGYHSATSIAASTPAAIRTATGLSAEVAESLHVRAGEIAVRGGAALAAAVDFERGDLAALAVFTPPAAISDFLKEIPGYADFFGDQDYCDCKHCRSILGPAAYFVDLMRFIEEHVTTPIFGAQPPLHRIALRSRRPDLWERLELTCANTTTEIPYLEVINEILEDAVARDVNFANLNDRTAVLERVYAQELPVRVNSFRQPFHLPFTELAIYLRHFDRTLADLSEAAAATGDARARLRLGLAPIDFELITNPLANIADLAVVYGIPFPAGPAILPPFDVQVLLPAMGLGREQLGALIATRWVTGNGMLPPVRISGARSAPNSVQNDVENISGLSPAVLERMHRSVRLWRATGWEIGELDLARTHLEFSGNGADLDATIVAGIALIHRLGTVFGISVEDTIALFSGIPDRAIFVTSPAPDVRRTIPLLDRLFNQPRDVELGGRFPQANTRVTHPALAVAPVAADRNLVRLEAGLSADEDQLYQLIVGLARPLGLRLSSAVAADRELALSARNLALLYRHARLARLLRVRIPELFAIAALAPEITFGFVDSLSDVEAVIRAHRWITESRWSIPALVRALRPGMPAIATSTAPLANTVAAAQVTLTITESGVARPPETIIFANNANLEAAIADWNGKTQTTIAYRADALGLPSRVGNRFAIRTRARGTGASIEITADTTPIFTAAPPLRSAGTDFVLDAPTPAAPAAGDLARELVAEVAESRVLIFADTLFARIPGVTEVQSRAAIAANAARLEATGAGEYRLAANFDPVQPLALAGLNAALEPQLRALLILFHGDSVLRGALPGKLGLDPDRFLELLAMLGEDLAAANVFAELRDPAVAPVRIERMIARLRRLAEIFGDERIFDPPALRLIRNERARFGIADFDRIDLSALRAIELFRALLEPSIDRGEERPDLAGMIVRYTLPAGFVPADLGALARLLGCDVALIDSLQRALPRRPIPFQAIEQLLVASLTCRRLGVGGAFLAQVTSTDYARLADASTTVQAALRAKYPEEAEWEKALEPHRDAVLSRRRDGLVAYLTRSRQTYPFTDATDLYNYFLLDVQLEGVVRTTRIAAAIASAQLYVHRVLMNLEETPAGDPQPVRVPPQQIPGAEWEWRQNYRVWEANRKVFLFPENYLEPELRDDKTPLFRALEEELLSKPITEEAVREAYARYLRGFDELASLTIAGSYHERDSKSRRDVLHLVGATGDDPPVFHYRRVENAHYGLEAPDRATRWGAWEKVDLQIPTRIVSPVVHNGQLYLFWVRYVTKSLNQVTNGDSKFAGYSHRAHVELSKRRIDGTWTAPQAVKLVEEPFVESGDGIVLDPLVARTANALQLIGYGELRLYSNYQPLYDRVVHAQPKDDYSLRGFGWDRIYPSGGRAISIRGINFQMWSPLDLYTRRIATRLNYDPVDPAGVLTNRGVPWIAPEEIEAILAVLFLVSLLGGLDNALDVVNSILTGMPRNFLWSELEDDDRTIHALTLGERQYATFDAYTFSSLLLARERIDQYKQPLSAPGYGLAAWRYPQWHEDVTNYLEDLLSQNPILTIPGHATIEAVNGATSDAIIQNGRDVFHIGFQTVDGKPFVLRRLNTSLSEELARKLFNEGLDPLLATDYQMATNEPPHGLSLVASKVADRSASGTLDFSGAMGTYLGEIFFEIPFLLADHLNSLGEYEAAQRWYHFVFDPTSSEVGPDRAWRYRRLRGLTVESLRERLEDPGAIEAYKSDPFNPHAIARMRLTAYQKALVMRYIDNLLDWGDDLFARAYSQLNQEYLREATLKYVLAQQILGRRPAQLGECGEARGRTLDAILRASRNDSEFLVELETWILPPHGLGHRFLPAWAANVAGSSAAGAAGAGAAGATYRGRGSIAALGADVEVELGRKLRPDDVDAPPLVLRERVSKMTAADFEALAGDDPQVSSPPSAVTHPTRFPAPAPAGFMTSFARQISTVFCVPHNPTLLEYWDRVEDRLYKIRNSLDPQGNFRRLPPFAPPIDPALLVRARAAGLGPEDVLAQAGGDLPAYRFVYLIEKAKSSAAAVQAFGAALLAALEKRDAEELANLRNTHEKNLLKLNRDIRRAELSAAEIHVAQVGRQQAAARYRTDYFSTLISNGLSTAERFQVAFRVTAGVLRAADALLKLAAGIGYLIPEVGSPFAMKYGGKQLGDAYDALAQSIQSTASIAELVAETSGLIAGFDRREEGWRHDLQMAEHDLRVLDRERAASELRRDIARKSLELHERTEEQHRELLELYRDKFSGFGLYTFMSRQLQLLHRLAFGQAVALARLAERAYHFELPGDAELYVGGDWEGARSGLLSGEKLALDLARMERRFIEGNTRRFEITQSFSLEQIDPAQLIRLRETGAATLSIPEFYFDLFYPGQYRRQIRGVRVSIPTVSGPYTNVAARLVLTGSRIRRVPQPGPLALEEVPPSRSDTVATSNAQNDGGVFELSFRDERYNPFEGAGAVSDWSIELPSLLRPFDYRTISDVVLSLSYTAEEERGLRAALEDPAGAHRLSNVLAATPRVRAFSMRREFSAAFHRLLASPPNTEVNFDIGPQHLPFYVRGQATAVRAEVVLATDHQALGAFAVSVNGRGANGFARGAPAQPYGGSPAVAINNAFAAGIFGRHRIAVTNAGGLAAAGAPPRLDEARLHDLILVIAYTSP